MEQRSHPKLPAHIASSPYNGHQLISEYDVTESKEKADQRARETLDAVNDPARNGIMLNKNLTTNNVLLLAQQSLSSK